MEERTPKRTSTSSRKESFNVINLSPGATTGPYNDESNLLMGSASTLKHEPGSVERRDNDLLAQDQSYDQ